VGGHTFKKKKVGKRDSEMKKNACAIKGWRTSRFVSQSCSLKVATLSSYRVDIYDGLGGRMEEDLHSGKKAETCMNHEAPRRSFEEGWEKLELR